MAAEPRSSGDLAQLLMEKAAGDEKILLRLIDDEDIPDDGLGFHAQQAVEKRIKAVLAHRLCKAECAAVRDPADSARLRAIQPGLGSESQPAAQTSAQDRLRLQRYRDWRNMA